MVTGRHTPTKGDTTPVRRTSVQSPMLTPAHFEGSKLDQIASMDVSSGDSDNESIESVESHQVISAIAATESNTKEANKPKRQNTILNYLRFLYATENSESVTRDQLANERSYLSYIRAALYFMSISISMVYIYKKSIVEEIILLLQNGDNDSVYYSEETKFYNVLIWPMSLIFSSLAVILCLNGLARYFSNLNSMFESNEISVDRLMMLSLLFVLFCSNIYIIYQVISLKI
ncbi:hypothetical protein CANARDRAFT_20770 [[Candida] arabinofermentans NRRL YB-2248]|uniref:DUF202 domain-containing protein n=1 Tax=[Candida] arabinofermentans NRRL YB-2248 TaxID=983967 RepID=A0A1E4T8G0_9ASCO|nr:hypothetical protein CANARDRAFT_20770 [[Candida] arabinofermentans NRRL YB-2248]